MVLGDFRRNIQLFISGTTGCFILLFYNPDGLQGQGNMICDFSKTKIFETNKKLLIGKQGPLIYCTEDNKAPELSDLNLTLNDNCLYIQKNQPFYIEIPLCCDVEYNEIYEFSVEIKTNFSDTCLDNVYFLNQTKVKNSKINLAYHQFSHFDFKKKENNWIVYKFRFIGLSKLNRFRVWFRYIKENEFIIFKNLSVSRFPLPEEEQRNIIPNGDFEYNYYYPDNLWFDALGVKDWQETSKSGASCIETRNGELIHENRENKYFIVNENGETVERKIYVALGTPDINSINQFSVNGGIIPYSGRYYGRLTVSYNGILRDGNHSAGEYFQCKLKNKLEEGKTYIFSMAYRHDPTSYYVTNTLGVRLSRCALMVYDGEFMNQIYPDCSFLISENIIKPGNEWHFISIEYVALGGEEYITIGPFNKQGVAQDGYSLTNNHKGSVYNQAFYLIDKISLVEK